MQRMYFIAEQLLINVYEKNDQISQLNEAIIGVLATNPIALKVTLVPSGSEFYVEYFPKWNLESKRTVTARQTTARQTVWRAPHFQKFGVR